MPLPALLAVLLLVTTPPESEADGQRLPLTGSVTAPSGAPVKGATVLVHTASPRVGTSSTCPSCYLDCGKKAVSGARGDFRIEALDPRLRFDLLVMARGYKARIVSGVDPRAGAQTIALDRLDLAAVDPERLIRGRLTLPSGRPAAGALVQVNGVRQGDTTRFGGTDQVDPVAVTDEQGEFVLVARQPVSEVLVVIEGPGFARRPASFSASHLRLTAGVTVKGRVLAGGRPVPGVAMGLVQKDRHAGTFVGTYEATTDAEGHFTFRNVPPRLPLHLFGKMESFGEAGVPPTVPLQTGDDGSTLDAGDLTVMPGHVVAGRLVLSDGKPVPEGTRLLLSREEAWDRLEVVVGPEGSFQFRGVPVEKVSLSANVRGYRFSLDNPSVDWRSRAITGRADRDVDDLFLVMEPGRREPTSSATPAPPGFAGRDVSEQPLQSGRSRISKNVTGSSLPVSPNQAR
jgi:hypothetical protein